MNPDREPLSCGRRLQESRSTHLDVKPWGPVEQLLLAVGAGTEQLSATVERLGLETAADAVVEELTVRCVPPDNDVACRFQLELRHDADRAGRTVTIAQGALSVERGWSESAVARISFDMVELLRSLFDPASAATGLQRDVTWLARPRTLRRWRPMAEAMQSVLTACDARPADLGDLSIRFGSDKWASLHWYTQHYQRHFGSLRSMPIRLLEIGIGGYSEEDEGGASLRMWQSFFPRGLVYGLDIFPKPHVDGPRIRAIMGDQGDVEFLDVLGRQLGPFDIVIDDGSHINEHVKASFHGLFPHVRPGGLYIIEDLETSYWPGYGGNDQDLTNADTSIHMLKGLIDGLNHQAQPRRQGDPCYTDRHVVGLHLYHNLAIVEKGLNADEPMPSFIRRRYSGAAVDISRASPSPAS